MIKVTMIFEQGGGTHGSGKLAGWSETWWKNVVQPVDWQMLSRLFTARVGMLTNRAALVGYRIKEIGGGVQVARYRLAGAIATEADIPQMSLSCFTRTADLKHSKFFRLRGLSDARVSEGVYVPVDYFQTAFTNFASVLEAEQWGWKGLAENLPTVRINSIDANGNVVCAAGAVFAANQYVVIRRSKNTFGNSVGGKYRILARTSDTNFQLANWVGGVVDAKGTVGVYSDNLYIASAANTKFTEVTTQKVGRPFFSYRGRASKR